MSAGRPGEAALIARYFAPLAGEGAHGLLDDAASLIPRPGHDLVLTTDAIVFGIHCFADDPPASIAVKALATNLSDLAAKGAAPRGFLLTLALAQDWTESWLAGFAEGLRDASAQHGCALLGGDTVKANSASLIAITAIGEVPEGAMVRRQGAEPGDVLCVSGSIGDAALGLRLRLDPPEALAGLDERHRAHLSDRYLHPRPRLTLGPVLRRHARTAMDISDGLAGDLAKMLREGTSARVEVAQVPLSEAATAALAREPSLIVPVLSGGDDYEILCAVPPEALSGLLADAREAGVPMQAIGRVEAGEGPPVFFDAAGARLSLGAGSFSHF